MQEPLLVEWTADVSTLFYISFALISNDIKNDMNTLLNVHTELYGDLPHRIGLATNALPEANGSQTGVSSGYVRKANHNWFVLRIIYNRREKAQSIIKKLDVQAYMPMHYVQEFVDGKKKRIKKPLLPNFIFVYTTREKASMLVQKTNEEPSCIKYYLDKTLPIESNGKNPPLIVPIEAMNNFIKATCTENDHVRIVTFEQCHYKSGDIVRVIAGEFKGVVGKVARIAGQQRVVVSIVGLCLVATAYIPTDYIEVIK